MPAAGLESTHDLIVIGGGPAGSTAAAIAARRGLDVLLLEAGRHPRTHVGESLLPGIIPILDEMGVLSRVEEAGFHPKTGSTHRNWGRTPEWELWFRDTDEYDHAWLVDRSKFDHLLWQAAVGSGARAHEDAAARELLFEGERLTGIDWLVRGEGGSRRARAPFVIDATGQAALVARKLGAREVISGLRHLAAWAHYEDARRLPPPREAQAFFVAERSHWLWLFPLSETRASVGVVSLDAEDAPRPDLDALVQSSESFSRVLGSARRVTPVRVERDWSYRIRRVTGPGWLLAGDASGFIDPVLSTGVFLAMHAGWHAGHTVADAVLGLRPAHEALDRYQQQHAELFTDLLRMVRFYYQQNLFVEDYFWESKRILVSPETELKPQKAFLILTSGLVRNLPLDRARVQALASRTERASSESGDLEYDVPDDLGFVCLHFRQKTDGDPALVFVLIEPSDPAAPSLFRTRSFDVNCIAPRYGNDPIREPTLEPHLRAIERGVRELDVVPEETLAAFYRRARPALEELAASLAPSLELVRVFGE